MCTTEDYRKYETISRCVPEASCDVCHVYFKVDLIVPLIKVLVHKQDFRV